MMVRHTMVECTVCKEPINVDIFYLKQSLIAAIDAGVNSPVLYLCSASCTNVYDVNPLAYEGLGFNPKVELERLKEKHPYVERHSALR